MNRNNAMSLNHINRSFPGARALHDISFELGEGEVLALLGENDAEKSTLIKCITGAYGPMEGNIELFRREYHTLTLSITRGYGINTVYQEFNLMMDLPIMENVFMGNNPGRGILVDYPQILKQCREVFETFGIDTDPEDNMSVLSPAMMQIVKIAKATMLDLKILILDKPTAPPMAKEARILFQVIDRLKQQGVSVIYILRRLEEVFKIYDRAIVTRNGEMAGETAVKDTGRTQLIKMMIGREPARLFSIRKPHISEGISLNLRNVSGNRDEDISFEVHKGEVLGVVGLVGVGRVELTSVIFCDIPRETGNIFINGKKFKGTQPWHVIEQRISYLPEDRKRRRLLLDKSTAINPSLASIKKCCKNGIIDRKKEFSYVDFYCRKFRVKTLDYENETQYLSGGNQQEVIVGKWLTTKNDIVIFDEPTRGTDVGTEYEIYEIINQLADGGKMIIIMSSEFEELIEIADHVTVMSEGRLVGKVGREGFDKELLLGMTSDNH